MRPTIESPSLCSGDAAPRDTHSTDLAVLAPITQATYSEVDHCRCQWVPLLAEDEPRSTRVYCTRTKMSNRRADQA